MPALKIEKPEIVKPKAEPSEVPPGTKPAKTDKIDDFWTKLLEKIKGEHNTLYGILRMAEVSSTKPHTLDLTFQFPFHMKRASEAKHLAVINKAIKELSGKDYEINFIKRTIEVPKKGPKKSPEVKENSAINTVRDVFGDAQLIE